MFSKNGDNRARGGVAAMDNYLSKENDLSPEDEPTQFFNDEGELPNREERIELLEKNVQGLKSHEKTWAMDIYSPSEKELDWIGSDVKKLEELTIKWMDKKAEAFGNEFIKSSNDMAWYAKVERYKWIKPLDKNGKELPRFSINEKGEKVRNWVKKPGNNLHVHVVRSLIQKGFDADMEKGIKGNRSINRARLSTHRTQNADYETTNKIKGKGFDVYALKQIEQEVFDEATGYNRDFTETLDFALSDKLGKEFKNGKDINSVPAISDNLRKKLSKEERAELLKLENDAYSKIDATKNRVEGEIQNIIIDDKSMEYGASIEPKIDINGEKHKKDVLHIWDNLQTDDGSFFREKDLEGINKINNKIIKQGFLSLSFGMNKVGVDGKIDIATYIDGKLKADTIQPTNQKEGLIIFQFSEGVLGNYGTKESKHPETVLFAESPIEAMSFAQLNKIDKYIVVSTAGNPTPKQLEELEKLNTEGLNKIVVSNNGLDNRNVADKISKTVGGDVTTPNLNFRSFNQIIHYQNKNSGRKVSSIKSDRKKNKGPLTFEGKMPMRIKGKIYTPRKKMDGKLSHRANGPRRGKALGKSLSNLGNFLLDIMNVMAIPVRNPDEHTFDNKIEEDFVQEQPISHDDSKISHEDQISRGNDGYSM